MKKPVPVMSESLNWSSMIGNVLINFSTLDLLVQDFLQANLSPEEFAKLRVRAFHDRVEGVQKFVRAHPDPADQHARDQFFVRLEPVRELRNHIAHGLLRVTLAEDQKNWIMTLSLPRDLDGSSSEDARHLTFPELLQASQTLTGLIEDFKKLFGKYG